MEPRIATTLTVIVVSAWYLFSKYRESRTKRTTHESSDNGLLALPAWSLYPTSTATKRKLCPNIAALLSRFEIDPIRGFLQTSCPLSKLPPYFMKWETLGQEMPKLLGASVFRAAASPMEILDADKLGSVAELRRAYLLLSMFAHAFVWGETPPSDFIPDGIAAPLLRVAAKLDMPPILTHMSIVMYNWRLLDPRGPITTSNLATLNTFLGSSDESWFFLLTVQIEAEGGAAVPALLQASRSAVAAKTRTQQLLNSSSNSNSSSSSSSSGSDGSGSGNGSGSDGGSSVEPSSQAGDKLVADEEEEVKEVTEALETVSEAIAAMIRTMERMPQGCAPFIFYHRVRPFLSGWKSNPSLPHGLRYGSAPPTATATSMAAVTATETVTEATPTPTPASSNSGLKGGQQSGVGVAGMGEVLEFHGGSAAQSTVIPCLDAVLGVLHTHAVSSPFLREMEGYMPPPHREFLTFLRQSSEGAGGVREFVLARSPHHARLQAAYNSCIQGLTKFRGLHMKIVQLYIIQQQQGSNAAPSGTTTLTAATSTTAPHQQSPQAPESGGGDDDGVKSEEDSCDKLGAVQRGGGGEAGRKKGEKGLSAAAGGKGTGGSDLMTFLKPVSDETTRSKIVTVRTGGGVEKE